MAADWISPRDRLPDQGVLVEISILPNSMDVSTAKRLGEGWWIVRTHGASAKMCEPPAPAYWRPIGRKTARAA